MYKILFFVSGATAPPPPHHSGPWLPRSRGLYITHNDAPQLVGLLWMDDQLAAETSAWQHTTLIKDRHPCPGARFEPTNYDMFQASLAHNREVH